MNILRIGLASLALAAAGLGGSSGANKGYVGLFGDQAVAAFDTTTYQVLTMIPVTAPDGLVITPDGSKVYVASADSGSVKVIDTRKDMVSGSIAVGNMPQGLSITPDGKRVIVAVQGDGKVVVIDTASDTVVGQAMVGKPHSTAVSPDGQVAYIGSQVTGATSVTLLGTDTGAVQRANPVDRAPRALAYAPWGKIYFSAIGLDALEVMDLSGQLGPPIATGGSPHDTRPTVDGKLELLVSQAAGDLEFIDPNTASVIGKVATGNLPHWIGLSSDGKLAWVTNERDNNVVAVDLTTRAVVQTIAIGSAPRKIAIQP